jgi:hypothetical protein
MKSNVAKCQMETLGMKGLQLLSGFIVLFCCKLLTKYFELESFYNNDNHDDNTKFQKALKGIKQKT